MLTLRVREKCHSVRTSVCPFVRPSVRPYTSILNVDKIRDKVTRVLDVAHGIDVQIRWGIKFGLSEAIFLAFTPINYFKIVGLVLLC